MSMDGLKPPTELSFDGNLEENWRNWIQKFEFYLLASEKSEKPDKIKCALFLHCAGERAIEVFNSLTFTDNEKDKYEVLRTKFADHMSGRKDVSFERSKFWARNQKPGELFVNYLADVRKQAKNCEYGDLEEGLIRDRIVQGVHSVKTKEKLMCTNNLTLDKAVEICKMQELNESRLRDVVESANVDLVGQKRNARGRGNGVNSFGRAPRGRGGNHFNSGDRGNHFNSGGRGNHFNSGGGRGRLQGPKRDETTGRGRGQFNRRGTTCGNCNFMHEKYQCPARHQVCYSCNRTGHFQRCCPGRKVYTVEEDYMYEEEPHEEDYEAFEEAENEMEEEEEDMNIFAVDSDVKSKKNKWIVPIKLANVIIPMKLDTGSDVNIITLKDYQAMKKVSVLKESRIELKDYSGKQITVIGEVTLRVQFKSAMSKAKFIVCPDGHVPVMGRHLCETLGLVKLVLSVEKDNMSEQYNIFGRLGCLPGEMHIKLRDDAEPIVEPCRKVPFGKMKQLKEELKKMEDLKVITKVEEPTEWVNSMHIVYKQDGSLRVVLDPRHLNKAICREHFQLPSREEIISKMKNAHYFSKLDCTNGFWQIKLDDPSSRLCTFNTPFGRYRYLRLPFGVSSAAEIFHRTISHLFENLENVATYMDDVIVWGSTKEEHDVALHNVLKKCQEVNLTLKKEKCLIGTRQLTFIGETIGEGGVKPDPQKVKAILEFTKPTNKGDVLRFLGMVKYLARFIPDLSHHTYHLRQLTKPQNMFNWSPTESEEFMKLKKLVVSERILKFFDPNKETRISCDASMKGLGAILEQRHGTVWMPVAYASKTLTECQSRYAPIERETLAIDFACERFHQYIFGKKVVVNTDHKPLIAIFSKGLNSCSPRIQRLRLKLCRYDLHLNYVPGKQMHVADALSRTAVHVVSESCSEEQKVEAQVKGCVDSLPVTDQRREAIKVEYQKDREMTTLKETIITGWPEDRRDCPNILLPYWNFRDEMTVYDGLILKNSRIVIPSSLRSALLQRIHAGHLGQEKCKERARTAVFWPGMNREITETIQSCEDCTMNQNSQQREPLKPHYVPSQPWSKVGADLFHSNGHDYLVIIDYLSCYPDVYRLPSQTSKVVIQAMKQSFARFGIPKLLISDNGPCFSSAEFEHFAQEWEFTHHTSSPHYPQSNGLAEKGVKIVKDIFAKSQDPQLGLLVYRSTPIINGLCPAQLCIGRMPRNNLPSLPETPTAIMEETAQMKRNMRMQQKKYYDGKSAKELRQLERGEKVRFRPIGDKRWKEEAVVLEEVAPRSYKVLTDSGLEIRRNRRDLMLYREEKSKPHVEQKPLIVRKEPQIQKPCRNSEIMRERINTETQEDEIGPVLNKTEPALRRSTRIRKPVKRLIED